MIDNLWNTWTGSDVCFMQLLLRAITFAYNRSYVQPLIRTTTSESHELSFQNRLL